MNIYLVACAETKVPRPHKAKDLYISPLFKGSRAYVERRIAATGGDWFVLSALHGLLDPESVTRPYNNTLVGANKGRRERWARQVVTDIGVHYGLQTRWAGKPPLVWTQTHFVFLAGEVYREFLIPLLEAEGATTCVPMQGLGIGKQLQYLKNDKGQGVMPL
jgi:hypothetical protein